MYLQCTLIIWQGKYSLRQSKSVVIKTQNNISKQKRVLMIHLIHTIFDPYLKYRLVHFCSIESDLQSCT